jgi:short-subunit dehydrogenase
MKYAVITGASTGIGFASASMFVENGFHVYGSVRSEEDADRLRKSLGPMFSPLLFDVTDHEAIQEASREVANTMGSTGHLAALVNNAGIAVNGPLEHLPIDRIRQQFEVNITGLMGVTQAFLPLLKPRDGRPSGRIINIGSISGIIASPFTGAYAASKHALEGLTDALRRELLVYDIPVVLIQPGPIRTEIWRKARESENPWIDTAYGPILKNRDRVIDRTEESALPVERVASVVYQSAVARKPRLRYLIDRSPWRIRMAQLMPASWIDRMVRKTLTSHLSGTSSSWRGWR